MDAQDHRKNHSLGNGSHGVHFCSRCGWPFPNSHPSAKHRRAHRKICGTIEGYKQVDSEKSTRMGCSDDEHLSDDERETPCTKLTDKTEKSISGNGAISNRSEDEAFADAVDEFPSGCFSPRFEPVEECGGSATTIGEKVAKDNPDGKESLENTDKFQPCSSSTLSCEMGNPEVSDSLADLSGGVLDNQDLVSSSTNVSIAHQGGKSGTEGDLHSVTSKTLVGSPEQIKVINAHDSAAYVALETEPKGNVHMKLDGYGSELTAEVKKKEDISDAATNVGVVQSTEAEHTEHGNASVDISEIKSNPAQETEEESFVLLTVPHGVHVDNAGVQVQEPKGYKVMEFQQSVFMNLCETTKKLEGEAEESVDMENCSAVRSGKPCTGMEVSSLDVPDSMYNNIHQGENDKVVLKELCIEREASVSDMKQTINEVSEEPAPIDGLAITMEKGKGAQTPEEHESYDVFGSLQQMGLSETVIKAHTVAEGDAITDSVCLDDSVNCESDSIQVNANDGEEMFKSLNEGDDAESKIVQSDSSNVPSEFEVHAKPNELDINDDDADGTTDNSAKEIQRDDDGGNCEQGTSETCENAERVMQNNLSLEIKTRPEDAITPARSAITSDQKFPENESTGSDRVSCVPEVTKDAEISGIHETQRDIGSLQKTSESHMMKEQVVSSLVAKSVISSSMVAENTISVVAENTTSALRAASGFHSQTIETDAGFTKSQQKASAVDVSVDSSSQSDSLEVNCGSVSVLSMQSDTLVAIDAGAEKANIEPANHASNRQHTLKSEIFKPPSLMTLAEPIGKDFTDGKTVASKTNSVPNPSQPLLLAASSQAAWFPSLTQFMSDSDRRKKNEEIIDKITNWNTVKQQHVPLKNLLSEARSPKQVDENKNDSAMPSVSSILGPEISAGYSPRKGDEGRVWDSPARRPVDIKREGKKVKGRPFWVPFVCCSSVN